MANDTNKLILKLYGKINEYEYSMLKARKLLLGMSAVFLLSASQCTEPKHGSVIGGLANEQLGVSILSVNLLGVSNVPRDSQSGVPWRTRYTRIFTWMRDTGKFPDVIVLQEVVAFMQCAFDPTVRDYEAINFLRNGISDAAGEQYRIAYLIVGKPGGGTPTDWTGNIPSGGCSSSNGKALLYRPSRLRNVITSPSAGESVVSPYDSPFSLLTTHLVMSAQCCPLNLDGSDVCPVTPFMDGSMIRPLIGPVFRDTCPTRQGVAFTRHRRAMQGTDPNKPREDAIFSRFELMNEPGSYIHIYNVHRGWGVDPNVQAPDNSGHGNIDQLVTDMEGRFHSQNNPTLYPPILVGDFNIGINEVDTYFPRFEVGMWGPPFPEVIGVLFGKSTIFLAKQKAYANFQEIMPPSFAGEDCYKDQETLWSDHCGIFFRVEPSRR